MERWNEVKVCEPPSIIKNPVIDLRVSECIAQAKSDECIGQEAQEHSTAENTYKIHTVPSEQNKDK